MGLKDMRPVEGEEATMVRASLPLWLGNVRHAPADGRRVSALERLRLRLLAAVRRTFRG